MPSPAKNNERYSTSKYISNEKKQACACFLLSFQLCNIQTTGFADCHQEAYAAGGS